MRRRWPEDKEWTAMSKLKRRGSEVRKQCQRKHAEVKELEILVGLHSGQVEETKSKLLGRIGLQSRMGNSDMTIVDT